MRPRSGRCHPTGDGDAGTEGRGHHTQVPGAAPSVLRSPPPSPGGWGGAQGGLHSFCLQACLSGRARADLCIVSKRSPALSHANAALKAARCQTDEIVALFSLLRDGRRGKGPQRAQPALGGGDTGCPLTPPHPASPPQPGRSGERSAPGASGAMLASSIGVCSASPCSGARL